MWNNFAALMLYVSLSHASGQTTDKKLQAVEQSLTAEQKQWLEEYLAIPHYFRAHWFNPALKIDIGNRPTQAEERAAVLRQLAAGPEKSRRMWRTMQWQVAQWSGWQDQASLLPGEKEAAGKLPADARAAAVDLLQEDVDKFLAARRKLLAHGPACRGLVVEQIRRTDPESFAYLRLRDFLRNLESLEKNERRSRAYEEVLGELAKLKKARAKNKAEAELGFLLAADLVRLDKHPDFDPLAGLSNFNFRTGKHDYGTGTALGLHGNGLSCNFFGGQDNRILDLGAVDFAKISVCPKEQVTAKWKEQHAVAAAVDHVYLVHVLDAGDRLDFAVKFKVLDAIPSEWVIFEWQRIAQVK